MMTIAIVAVFIVGYACIALESGLKINKAATALLMCVACWVLYMTNCIPYVTQFHGIDFAPYARPPPTAASWPKPSSSSASTSCSNILATRARSSSSCSER